MTTTSEPQILELDTNVYLRLHDGLTNSGFIIGDDGVLVIDSLRVPSFAVDLVQDIRRVTSKPIKYVINTHSHWDHSWGNENFSKSIIIGHTNCYTEMIDVEWNQQWMDKITTSGDPWAQEASFVKITPPNLTFDNSMRLFFGGREISLRYFGKAHTSGDIFIYLPNEKIVFTGDVIQNEGVPFLGDGYPNEWPLTDDRILELPVNLFASGHGPVGNAQDLRNARDFIHMLVDTMRIHIKTGDPREIAVEQTISTLKPRFGHWRSFDAKNEKFIDGLTTVYEKLTPNKVER